MSRRWSRDRTENRLLGVLRPLVVAALVIFAAFPFYYMVLLSLRPLETLLQNPGAVWVTVEELNLSSYTSVLTPTAEGGGED